MARYIPEGHEPPYYVDSRGWRESKNGPVYPSLEEATHARLLKGNPYYLKANTTDDDTGLWILVCIVVILAVFILYGLTNPVSKANQNDTYKQLSGSSYQQSEGRFFSEDPFNISPNPIKDHQQRESWHFNRLNGQWNPGLWSDVQHAIIFGD